MISIRLYQPVVLKFSKFVKLARQSKRREARTGSWQTLKSSRVSFRRDFLRDFLWRFLFRIFFQDFFHSFSLVISLVVPVKILTRDLCCDLSKLRVPSRIPVCPMVKLGLTNQLSFQWKHQNRNSEQKTHCLQWSVENCLQKLISVWNSLFVNRFEFAKTFSELFVWFKPPSLVKAFRNSRKRVSREQLSVLLNVWRLYRDSHWDA